MRETKKMISVILAAALLVNGTVTVMGETETVSGNDDIKVVCEKITPPKGLGPVNVSGSEDESGPVILTGDGAGNCGDDLSYTYTESSKTLKITGRGKMWDFESSVHGTAQEFIKYDDSHYSGGETRYTGESFSDGGTGSQYHYDTYKWGDGAPENIQPVPVEGFGYDYISEMKGYYYRSLWDNDTEITDLDLSDAVTMTRIGNRAFYTKENLKAKVTFPENVMSVGCQAFEDTGITSITLNDKLESIGYGAFMNCKSLKGSVSLPEELEVLGERAFFGDASITGDLNIPKNVSVIGAEAFRKTGLNGKLTFESGSKLEEIKDGAFRSCFLSGELRLPSGVKTIGQEAFMTNVSITEVYIPESMESIAENAFEDCTGIKKVVYEGTKGGWQSKGFDKIKALNDVEVEFQEGEKVTVTFDSMGGSDVPSQKVAFSGKAAEPADPEKEGFFFLGWYEDESCTVEWDFNIPIENDITLYAKWGDLASLKEGEDYYDIYAYAATGGIINPSGNVIVLTGKNKTFEISPLSGYRILDVYVDGERVGAVPKYTFTNVNYYHDIYADFIPSNKYRVRFEIYGSYDYIEDQILNSGDTVKKPGDPFMEGYNFRGWYKEETFNTEWDFANDKVTKDTVIYAKFEKSNKPSVDVYFLSSTMMHGKWVSTVIGKGCNVKLSLVNSEGAKLKGVPKKEVVWNVEPVYGNETGLEDYITVKNGKIKCSKNAPVGYMAKITATYEGSRATYYVSVIEKIGKMGYFDSAGKFKKSVTVERTYGSDFEFGYGPHYYNGEEGKYVGYYTKGNDRIGTALYQQPNGSGWRLYEYSPEYPIYYCGAIIPRKAKVQTKQARSYPNGYATLYYYYVKKGSSSVIYVAPDGSGKKFKVTFKVTKKKK